MSESLFGLLGGTALLALSGEALVRAAVALARRLGLPLLLIGITVVAAATSMPELAVSVESALAGTPGIAVGNVTGSNIANLALGLGVMGVLVPFTARRGALRRDVAALVLATAGFVVVGLFGGIGPIGGVLMVVALAAHLWNGYQRERRERDAAARIHAETPEEFGADWPTWLSLVVLAASTAGLIVGARFLLDGAVVIARVWGVSDPVIGLSVVALGTSLPEIATTAAAARRREHDVALGNLVGSSLFNLLAILGITAIVAPVPVDAAFIRTSGLALLAVTVLSIPWLTGRQRVGRRTGAAMLVGYLAYVSLATGVVALG